MPTRSASLNFTPGRSSLSSSNTSYPAASSSAAICSDVVRSFSSETLVAVTTTSNGVSGGLKILAWRDVLDVVILFVGTGNQVRPAFEGRIHEENRRTDIVKIL